ncbi:MAG: pantoate--beta-alanine ligase [Anaerolineales bacterium]|nr:pantoate--beta-alanine ligase [Anaerolineales bacterium]
MKLIHTLTDLRQAISALPRPLGLVPTMGCLHEGHLTLVRRARVECAAVGVSIFVNPAQFGPQEDLARYPRDLERDLALLEPAGADLVWAPEAGEVYPPGYQTYITVEEVAVPLEGAVRPGHFRGVATVVAKLFNAFTPERAYFGQKDAQQAAVIRRMARDLNFPLEVVVCPIIRERDGLAMSSRNTYLAPEERRAAAVLYGALSAARAAYDAGERGAEALREAMRNHLAAEPRAQIEYVSAADPDTLQELERVERDALFSMAVRIGKTRLIDNFLLKDGIWETGVVLTKGKA